jgi:hypothetical protein
MAGELVRKVILPLVTTQTASLLADLTKALGVSRDVLASDEETAQAWHGLPKLLENIPPQLRSVLHVRMCVAVATGLFDSAVNYAWNSAMIELREKVRGFGIYVVPQITGKKFDEQDLLDLKDADLLTLCLSLNLMAEDGYFFLDQCREVRNSFSAAHPPIGTLDAHEFLGFLNRCAKYALTDTHNPKGVDTGAFIAALKKSRYSEPQTVEWTNRLTNTHEAQRHLLIGMLHGIYCDPDSSEETRLNALDLCQHFAPEFPAKLKSDLINRHSNYIAENQPKRQEASRAFFQKLALLALLSQTERHSIISGAARRLMTVHLEWNNFYNEPPFATRLLELSAQAGIPETAQAEYVLTVAVCGAGNPYGVSVAAVPSYQAMVRGFSPREIKILLDLPQQQNRLSARLGGNPSCRRRFKELVALVEPASVPISSQALHKKWTT